MRKGRGGWGRGGAQAVVEGLCTEAWAEVQITAEARNACLDCTRQPCKPVKRWKMLHRHGQGRSGNGNRL